MKRMTDRKKEPSSNPPHISLRVVRLDDLPTLYAFESNPTWLAMAMLKPRSEDAFNAIWKPIAAGEAEDIVQRVILSGDDVCGTIGCQPRDGKWSVGYGLGSRFWGKGIATRALGLFLASVSTRPLFATTAATNTASIHVLQKHGFVLQSSQYEPATGRYLACEVTRFVLQ